MPVAEWHRVMRGARPTILHAFFVPNFDDVDVRGAARDVDPSRASHSMESDMGWAPRRGSAELIWKKASASPSIFPQRFRATSSVLNGGVWLVGSPLTETHLRGMQAS